MTPYHKIYNVFDRDPETNYKTLIEGQFSRPEFGFLKDLQWDWTEKIDGTNIRVILEAGCVLRIRGRSDNAQIQPRLLSHLQETFSAKKLREVFDTDAEVTLYGEGYGAKIQKGGGLYVADGGVSFILFDVRVGKTWLERESVESVASTLNIPHVPVLYRGTLLEAVGAVRCGFLSRVADHARPAEGLVVRPSVGLMDRFGRRIIAKIKAVDFQEVTV